MERKTLFIIGTFVALAVMVGALIYIMKASELVDSLFEKIILPKPERKEEETKEENTKEPAAEEPVDRETLLTKDGFTITLPPGWQEALDFPEVLLMAGDTREEITNEKAKEADFITNFSIKSDDLKKYGKEYGAEDYASSIKTSLIQTIPGIEFTYEDQGIVSNNNAFFMEAESTQEEIDFKTLLVFIEDENDIIWVISFNTLQESWPAYQDLFYQIVESFKFKS